MAIHLLYPMVSLWLSADATSSLQALWLAHQATKRQFQYRLDDRHDRSRVLKLIGLSVEIETETEIEKAAALVALALNGKNVALRLPQVPQNAHQPL